MPVVDTAAAFAALDALVERFEAHTAAPDGDLAGVKVEDSWPAGRINSHDTVIVADADGSQTAATMRPGGGTRDDTFRVEVACAAVRKTSDARAVRGRAREIATAAERVVLGELRALVPGAQRARVVQYAIRQFVHDKGRECDVILTVECVVRLKPAGVA